MKPTFGSQVTVGVKPDGAFIWQADVKGVKQQFTGVSTYGDGILTLAQNNGPALVGRVGWNDPSHMTSHVVSDGPEDPGLSFAK